jgi:hypothetical protein
MEQQPVSQSASQAVNDETASDGDRGGDVAKLATLTTTRVMYTEACVYTQAYDDYDDDNGAVDVARW